VYPGDAVLTTAGASSLPQDSQKLSVALTGSPQDGQVPPASAGPPVT
jgi:hypothetical protein